MLLLKVSYLLGFLSEDGRSISGSAVWWKIQNVHQAMHCVTFGMHHCSCETILCPPQHINNSLNTHSRYLLLISCIGFSITSFVRTFNICCHVGFSPFLLNSCIQLSNMASFFFWLPPGIVLISSRSCMGTPSFKPMVYQSATLFRAATSSSFVGGSYRRAAES